MKAALVPIQDPIDKTQEKSFNTISSFADMILRE
jgi:hypothetical protein